MRRKKKRQANKIYDKIFEKKTKTEEAIFFFFFFFLVFPPSVMNQKPVVVDINNISVFEGEDRTDEEVKRRNIEVVAELLHC